MRRRLVLAACGASTFAITASARGQALALPPPPVARIDQRPGAALPMQMELLDDAGRRVRLGDYFGAGRPVLLVLGYYRCPQLCGLLMHGLLEALHGSGISRREWRIVGISIDPQDTPATADARRQLDLAYADFLLGAQTAEAPLDLHLLTASARDTQALAAQVGYVSHAVEDEGAREAGARFAHPAAVIVATPAGKVSRYLMGIRFDAAELKVALADAAGDRIGGITSRVALLCAHFDPQVGRHSAAVMAGMRIGGITLAAALASWCWRRRGMGGRP
jgi:protein SCO1